MEFVFLAVVVSSLIRMLQLSIIPPSLLISNGSCLFQLRWRMPIWSISRASITHRGRQSSSKELPLFCQKYFFLALCYLGSLTSLFLNSDWLSMASLRFNKSPLKAASQSIISASIFTHPGFLIIDHIHFQYNGFLYGILFWSILSAQEVSYLAYLYVYLCESKNNLLISGVIFAVLLNFKHIYMYLAVGMTLYVLDLYWIIVSQRISFTYCVPIARLLEVIWPIPRSLISYFSSGSLILTKLLRLGGAVVFVFAISLGPFVAERQLQQVYSRLFPFSRGLNHAYWAPNAWALVTALDRFLILGYKRLGLPFEMNEAGINSSSRGLVGDTIFGVLPQIKPVHTFIMTILFQCVRNSRAGSPHKIVLNYTFFLKIVLLKLWMRPNYRSFLTALTLSGFASFLFGWHVHEKAVLLVLLPFR